MLSLPAISEATKSSRLFVTNMVVEKLDSASRDYINGVGLLVSDIQQDLLEHTALCAYSSVRKVIDESAVYSAFTRRIARDRSLINTTLASDGGQLQTNSIYALAAIELGWPTTLVDVQDDQLLHAVSNLSQNILSDMLAASGHNDLSFYPGFDLSVQRLECGTIALYCEAYEIFSVDVSACNSIGNRKDIADAVVNVCDLLSNRGWVQNLSTDGCGDNEWIFEERNEHIQELKALHSVNAPDDLYKAICESGDASDVASSLWCDEESLDVMLRLCHRYETNVNTPAINENIRIASLRAQLSGLKSLSDNDDQSTLIELLEAGLDHYLNKNDYQLEYMETESGTLYEAASIVSDCDSVILQNEFNGELNSRSGYIEEAITTNSPEECVKALQTMQSVVTARLILKRIEAAVNQCQKLSTRNPLSN